ncbi:MAG: hypothetical protein EXS31_19080 [Pedosphaera sp.]|nr:hypothetical protein [Pedosphaera sp.]
MKIRSSSFLLSIRGRSHGPPSNEKLNDTWGRAFRNWQDANPPARLGNYADWLDWGRFWHDKLREHMRWRYSILPLSIICSLLAGASTSLLTISERRLTKSPRPG